MKPFLKAAAILVCLIAIVGIAVVGVYPEGWAECEGSAESR